MPSGLITPIIPGSITPIRDNRRATQIKVLYFDRSGWCVWAKRLEQGRFLADWKRVVTREID
ncbi:hypothetical protein GWC77_28855, partial [Paraburkholderia sp. NMBU_R16]|uniref:IS66 family insertion sequence element accessory protein TnpB n=1 Tax=Paraburkholderia sp. NMBU_R16 TaxID=2698676 RepID=UPI001563ABCF|nr:hypothetical protein [Paraburkholderia sp. NMBU_R16]